MEKEVAGCAIYMTRSLGPTLISAASTFALFVAANWGLNVFTLLSDPWGRITLLSTWGGVGVRRFQNLAQKFLLMLICMPFGLMAATIGNVLLALKMRQNLKKKGLYKEDGGSVAIIAGCPILIAIPPPPLNKPWGNLDHIGGKVISHSDLHSELQDPPLEFPLRVPSNQDITIAVEESSISNQDITIADSPHNTMTTTSSDDQKYILLHPPQSKTARRLLLELELVPTYEHLRILRSRSKFQSVVTLLQALGYMLGVAQRLAAAEPAAAANNISPLEAFIATLSLHVTLQLLSEFYAPSHFCHSLLLRLQPHHFSRLICAASTRPRPTASNSMRRLACAAYFMQVSVPCLLPAPLFYYALSTPGHCLLCFLSAFLLSLSPIVFLIVASSSRDRHFWPSIFVKTIIPIYQITGILLAVIATVKHWALFEVRSRDILFAWLFPHVPS